MSNSLNLAQIIGQTAPGIPGTDLALYLDAWSLSGAYLSSVSSWPDLSGNSRDATQGTGSLQPKLLPWTPAEGNYAHLPGVSENYISTPDSVAISVTGDLTVDVWGSMNDWFTEAQTKGLAAKRSITAGQYSWQFTSFQSGSTKQLLFGYTADGSTQILLAFAVDDIEDGAQKCVRAAFNSATGNASFYISDDGENFTLLGTTTGGSPSSIFDSNSPIEIGSIRNGSGNFHPGKFRRVRVYSGLPGALTLVAQFVANDGNANSSTVVSGTTGETWTLNRSGDNPARLVAAPGVLADGTDDIMAVASMPVFGSDPFTVLACLNYASASGASDGGIVTGPTNAFSLSQENNSPVFIAAQVGVGYRSPSTTIFTNHIASVRGYVRGGSGTYYVNGAAAGTTVDAVNYSAAIASILGSASAAGMFMNSLVVYTRALSAAEIRAVSRYLAGRASAGIVTA